MSIEIDWQTLLNDNGELSRKVHAFLDRQFSGLKLAPFVKDLTVTSFDLGSVAPEITIKHIGDPFYEFYEMDDSEEDEDNAETSENSHPAAEDFDSHPDAGASSEDVVSDAKTPALHTTTTLNDEPEELPTSHSRRTSRLLDSSDALNERHEIDGYLRYFQSSLRPGLLSNRSQLFSPFVTHAHNSSTSLAGAGDNPLNNSGKNHGEDPLNANLDATPKHQETPGVDSGSFGERMPPQQAAQQAKQPPEQSQQASDDHPKGSENDVQFFLEISYSGDMTMGLTATLLLNYPSPNFISLPLKLTITDLKVHVLAVMAIISGKIVFSVICDVDGETPGSIQRDSIDIIKNVRIDTEIGAQDNNGSILRNVGKVETFLLEKIRSVIRDEVAWPGWITFEL